MAHDTSSFVTAGGITIFTQTWTPDGPPHGVVLLAHGYAEHSGRYRHVAEALTGAGFALAALDLRGHGRSGGPRATIHAFSLYALDFKLFHEQVAATFGDVPHVVLGHSMGGCVALDYLEGDPLPVAALVTSGAYLRNAIPVPDPVRKVAPLLGKVLPWLPTQSLDAADVSRDPAVVRAYDADPLNYRGKVPAQMAAQLLTIGDRVLAGAGRITCPALVLHGTADRIADPGGSRELHRRLGSDDTRLELYEGLYHEVFNEPERDQVLGDVIDWLSERVG